MDRAVRQATLDLLAERGYSNMTITAVAQRAGTTTPAIYRRWSSKAALVFDVVFGDSLDDLPITGDVDHDVRSLVRAVLQRLGRPAGRAALVGLLSEGPSLDGVGFSFVLEWWARVQTHIEGSQASGDLRTDVPVDDLFAALVGPALVAAYIPAEVNVTDELVDRIASLTLDGIRSPRG